MARRDRKAKKQAPSVIARPKKEFPRRLWGYRRSAVDGRLAEIDATIGLLQVQIDATEVSAGQHDLVLRATRRSVDDVLERANADADAIRAAAEAEASRLIADAYEEEVETTIKGVMSLLGPLTILVMGVIIGTVAVGLLLPMSQLSSMIRM